MPYLQRQDLSYSLWWDGRNVCYTVGFGLRLLDDIVRETVSHITSSHPLYYLLVWVNRHKRTVNSQRPTQVWQPGLHWGAGTLHGKGQASGGAEAFAATMRRTHPMPKHKYTLYIYMGHESVFKWFGVPWSRCLTSVFVGLRSLCGCPSNPSIWFQSFWRFWRGGMVVPRFCDSWWQPGLPRIQIHGFSLATSIFSGSRLVPSIFRVSPLINSLYQWMSRCCLSFDTVFLDFTNFLQVSLFQT